MTSIDIANIKNRKEFQIRFETAMEAYVQGWWKELDDSAKSAVKLLQFSHSIISSMMFFPDDIGLMGYGMLDYCYFLECVKSFIESDQIDVTQGYSGYDNPHGYILRGLKCDQIGLCDIRATYENNPLLSRLPQHLKIEVVQTLCETDQSWKALYERYNENLRSLRKEYLWRAVGKLKKEVMG